MRNKKLRTSAELRGHSERRAGRRTTVESLALTYSLFARGIKCSGGWRRSTSVRTEQHLTTTATPLASCPPGIGKSTSSFLIASYPKLETMGTETPSYFLKCMALKNSPSANKKTRETDEGLSPPAPAVALVRPSVRPAPPPPEPPNHHPSSHGHSWTDQSRVPAQLDRRRPPARLSSVYFGRSRGEELTTGRSEITSQLAVQIDSSDRRLRIKLIDGQSATS